MLSFNHRRKSNSKQAGKQQYAGGQEQEVDGGHSANQLPVPRKI